MKLRVSEVMKVCMNHPGMWDDFIRAGQLDSTRQFIDIERPHFEAINRRHFDGGLGTLLHEIFSPVALIADALFGIDLANCGECGERELKLNDAAKG